MADAPARLVRFATAIADRWHVLAVTLAAGLLLCLSFPPFGWWYAAIPAFALLGWVLTRASTTLVGGAGYGLLFGLAFYLPLLPWISGLVGAVPWLALSFAEALFPALFGLVAVAVRKLPGWPLWFAGLWSAQEWLKSTVPFGGFPWGVVGFSQTEGPLLPLAYVGGAPLVSFAVVLVGFSLAALVLAIVAWWRRDAKARAAAPPSVVLPGVCVDAGTALGDAGLAERPQGRPGRGRRAARHRRGRAGQRAASRPGLQRPASRRARQPRPRDAAAGRRRAGRAGRAADAGHLAGELLGHRPAGQPGRGAADLRGGRRRSTRRSWSAGWSRRRATAAPIRCRTTP